MGKSLPSPTRLQNFARIISSDRIKAPKQAKPTSSSSKTPQPKLLARVDPAQLGLKMDSGGNNGSPAGRAARMPLSEVVSDCVRRWFHDTLKEAKAGDTSMQLLVGQMYNSGYGVRRDTEKGRTWISRASRGRSSAWKVSDKQPGYNASDSESEDVNDAKR